MFSVKCLPPANPVLKLLHSTEKQHCACKTLQPHIDRSSSSILLLRSHSCKHHMPPKAGQRPIYLTVLLRYHATSAMDCSDQELECYENILHEKAFKANNT